MFGHIINYISDIVCCFVHILNNLNKNICLRGRVAARIPSVVNKYMFKIDENKTIKDGFLAHEAAEVVPEAVTGEKDAMKDGEIAPQSIDRSRMIPLLTGALQEAIAKIEVLESKVAALEAS